MTWRTRRVLVILFVLLFLGSMFFLLSKPKRISANSVLVLDVNGAIEEQRQVSWLSAFNGTRPLVQHDYVDALDSAARDPRIRGLVVRIGPLETGWAKLEEIRAHIAAFRLSGKPDVCFLGYDGIDNPEYYLASACQQVWLVPTAPLGVRGMMADTLFLRGTFDKLKIVPDFYHIAEFKTYSNQFTEKKFTPAHREEVESLLHDIYSRYVQQVAASRGMSEGQFDGLVQKGPFMAQDAQSQKLVDRLAYWDQVRDFFKQRTGDWNPVDLQQYSGTLDDARGPKIAVIYASGLIVSGDSGNSTSGELMGGDTIAAEMRRARNDSSIRAIVLRVDSGGGSALASEVIRREVDLAHQVKPVIVSMSDVAASGGYWISMNADKIVAEPSTMTGSIGVVGGKFNIAGLYQLLGLSTDFASTADNATLYWDQQSFSPEQRAYFQKSLKETYQDFIHRVAGGRHLAVEEVDKVGKGRVWTGEQAKSLGLVDDLGGLDRAVAIAKDLAHISAASSVHLVRLPEEKNIWEQLFGVSQPAMESREVTVQALVRRLTGVNEAVQARIPFDLHIR
jgi:protease-4